MSKFVIKQNMNNNENNNNWSGNNNLVLNNGRTLLRQADENSVEIEIEQEPKFDDPDAQMPNLGLTEKQAASIAAFLAGSKDKESGGGPIRDLRSFVGDRLPDPPRQPHLVYFFAVGLLVGGVGIAVCSFTFVKLRGKQNRAS